MASRKKASKKKASKKKATPSAKKGAAGKRSSVKAKKAPKRGKAGAMTRGKRALKLVPLKAKLQTFATPGFAGSFRANCDHHDFLGPVRATSDEADNDALDHETANFGHLCTVLTTQSS